MMLIRPLRAHDRDLGRRPGADHVGAQVLGAHDDVGPAVGLAGNDRQLGHRGLGIGEEHLGPVLDDAQLFLVAAGQEAGDVDEADQRDVEGIAEADEARPLHRGLHVERTGEDRRVVGDDADRAPAQAGEANHQVLGVALVDLEELLVVDHGQDQLLDVIGLVGVDRHDLVQPVVHAVEGVAAFGIGRRLHVGGGQVAEQFLDHVQGVLLVAADEMGHAGDGGVALGAAQLLEGHLLLVDGLDHLGAGDEHVAGLVDHENEVGDPRRIDGAPGAGAHDHRDLGNDARGDGIAEKDVAVAGEAVDPLLDAGAARIVDADDRGPRLQRQVLDIDDLPGMHLAQRAPEDGEILGKRHRRPGR